MRGLHRREIFAVLAIIAAWSVAVPAQAQAPQSPPQARIVVTGEGSVAVPPDYAEIRTGVTTRGKTAKEALDANSKLMTAVNTVLQNAGIEQKDIQTSRFSIEPVYAQQQPNNVRTLTGFEAVNQVRVTVRQIAKLGDILDKLVSAGATDIRRHRVPARRSREGARSSAAGRRRRRAAQSRALCPKFGP